MALGAFPEVVDLPEGHLRDFSGKTHPMNMTDDSSLAVPSGHTWYLLEYVGEKRFFWTDVRT